MVIVPPPARQLPPILYMFRKYEKTSLLRLVRVCCWWWFMPA